MGKQPRRNRATAPDVTHLLVDAQRTALKYPDTFFAPPAEALGAITRGTLVKICDSENAERFWTEVVAKFEGTILATVANDCIRWPFATLLKFHERSVHDIASPGEMAKRALRLELEMEGLLEPPSEEQQRARMLGRVVEEHGDVFSAGPTDDPRTAPVDEDKVLAWFKEDTSRLNGTGLDADDLGIIHIYSMGKLIDDGMPSEIARAFFHAPVNLVLAPARVAEYYA